MRMLGKDFTWFWKECKREIELKIDQVEPLWQHSREAAKGAKPDLGMDETQFFRALRGFASATPVLIRPRNQFFENETNVLNPPGNEAPAPAGTHSLFRVD
jgi:hypothetical protein